MIEAIAFGTPAVELPGGAVPEVDLGGVTGPICDRLDAPPTAIDRTRTIGPANFIAGQFDSGCERIDRQVARTVAGSHMTMRQVVKTVEPQRNRVVEANQRASP